MMYFGPRSKFFTLVIVGKKEKEKTIKLVFLLTCCSFLCMLILLSFCSFHSLMSITTGAICDPTQWTSVSVCVHDIYHIQPSR